MLDSHDAAFIGTLVQRSGGVLGAGNATFTFTVTQDLKGAFKDTVNISSAADGAACGFEIEEGDEAAIFVSVEGGRLHSGLCSTLDADVMRAFIEPEPIVKARPTLLVAAGGGGGKGRHLWLFDDRGRLASASTDNHGQALEDMSLCPGGRTAVELWSGKVVVRALRTLRAVTVHRVPRNVGRVWCRDAAGRDVIGARRSNATGDWKSIVAVRSPGRPLVEGDFVGVEIVDDVLVAAVGRENTELRRIDLRSGRETLIHRATSRPGVTTHIAPGIEGFSISPDRTRVAFEVTSYPEQGDPSSDVFVYDITSGQREARAFHPDEGFEVRWLDDTSLLFSSYGADVEEAQVLSAADLRVEATLPKKTHWASLRRGDTLLGVDGPRLATVDVQTGEVSTLATIPVEYGSWVVRLPQPLKVRAGATTEDTEGPAAASEAPAQAPVGRPDPRGEVAGGAELEGKAALPLVPVAAAGALALLALGFLAVRRRRRRVA